MTSTEIPSILQRIVATKHLEIAQRQQQTSLQVLQQQAQDIHEPRRGFAAALRQKQQQGQIGIIAEIKKASPSKGIINHNFRPSEFAQQYAKAGAACLSVLTDEQYFQGHDDYLKQAKAACDLPILRKDFMVDPYQIYESYVLGADCILLIMACLDDKTVFKLHQLALQLGMDVLIETHSPYELERALQLPNSPHNIYGVNNRDLNTFNTDLHTTVKLSARLKEALDNHTDTAAHNIDNVGNVNDASQTTNALIVTESGIHSAQDIELMLSYDISNFLIGEQFMKTDHPGQKLQSLLDSVSTSK